MRRDELSELVVHIGAGFAPGERPHLRKVLATLRPHLGRTVEDVSVQASVQARGRREQRVSLRTTVPGWAPVVAVVVEADVTRAVHEAKRELIRQLGHQKTAHDNRRFADRPTRQPIARPRPSR